MIGGRRSHHHHHHHPHQQHLPCLYVFKGHHVLVFLLLASSSSLSLFSPPFPFLLLLLSLFYSLRFLLSPSSSFVTFSVFSFYISKYIVFCLSWTPKESYYFGIFTYSPMTHCEKSVRVKESMKNEDKMSYSKGHTHCGILTGAYSQGDDKAFSTSVAYYWCDAE